MSDEKIKDLIRKRGTFKSHLTIFSSFLNNLSEVLSPQTKIEVELRASKLESLYSEFDDVQLQIECSCDNPSEQYKERDAFESAFYKSLARAQMITHPPPTATSPTSSEHEESVRAATATGAPKAPGAPGAHCNEVKQHLFSVKLPEINLNKFDGTYSQWLEFRDMFQSMIHHDTHLSDITKFHYLRSYLEGSAALVIKSIEFSAANYHMAWEIICERYNNKRLLISNHVKALFSVFSVQKESSFQLRRVTDTFIKNLKSLEILKEPTEHWDTLLIYILCNKLDSQTMQEWEKHKIVTLQ